MSVFSVCYGGQRLACRACWLSVTTERDTAHEYAVAEIAGTVALEGCLVGRRRQCLHFVATLACVTSAMNVVPPGALLTIEK